MRILFGPEHDGLHIDPSEPNGYEWWYFDAISDDERYVLVVIFFLGTPMSPYYKAVVDGKNPLPKDWCGVFVSLHERTDGGYKERAYAYNLYKYDTVFNDAVREPNCFRDKPLYIRLGNSTVNGSYSHNGRRFTHSWMINLNERNLWTGVTHAELNFSTSHLLSQESIGDDTAHSWVCVAPGCRFAGQFRLSNGDTIVFSGNGYHDHNFGKLPWSDTKVWFWSRTHFGKDESIGGMVNYSWLADSGNQSYFIFWKRDGTLQIVNDAIITDTDTNFLLNKRGVLHQEVTGIKETGLEGLKMSHPSGWSMLQSSPFYKRFPVVTETQYPSRAKGSFIGIGEIFQPARLCGPIISRMMWTRIRRRS